MIFWICLFVLPVALLIAIFIYLLLRNRSEFRHLSAWAAIVSGFTAPLFALWGLVHKNAWQMPLAFEPGFEKRAWLVSIAATLFGLGWFIQSRRRYTVFVFALSLLLVAFWSTVILPLK